MEGYLLSEPNVRGSRKCMLSLWLNKGMFWVSEQRLVDQAKTICRNSWMTELKIEELEMNLAENDSDKEEERSADDTSSNFREKVRDTLTALEADEEIGNYNDSITMTNELIYAGQGSTIGVNHQCTYAYFYWHKHDFRYA